MHHQVGQTLFSSNLSAFLGVYKVVPHMPKAKLQSAILSVERYCLSHARTGCRVAVPRAESSCAAEDTEVAPVWRCAPEAAPWRRASNACDDTYVTLLHLRALVFSNRGHEPSTLGAVLLLQRRQRCIQPRLVVTCAPPDSPVVHELTIHNTLNNVTGVGAGAYHR